MDLAKTDRRDVLIEIVKEEKLRTEKKSEQRIIQNIESYLNNIVYEKTEHIKKVFMLEKGIC